MFGRRRTETAPRVVAFDARGGVSPGAILTGVVVAFGATFVLSAIVGGVLVAVGISNTPSSVVNAGVGAGIALVVAMFLAYLWGGYAAGRMARGAGLANGLLVPVAAIVVALIVGGIVTALGATANLNLPSFAHFNPNLPITSGQLRGRVLETSLWMALGAFIAMFLGGAIGGILGARWHTKLERQTLAARDSEAGAVATGTTVRTVPANRSDDDLDDDDNDDTAAVSASSSGSTTTTGTTPYRSPNPTVDEDSTATSVSSTETTGDSRA